MGKYMTKIENEAQYKWAVARVEELLPLVNDDTPRDDRNLIELERLSNLVADYSDEHFAIDNLVIDKASKLCHLAFGESELKFY